MPTSRSNEYCRRYEEEIVAAGGIDIQLLGIGRTGHIGFNEPGSGRDSRTRMITLDRVTRLDAASDFFGEENVPRRAITMGVGTILDAKTGDHARLRRSGRRRSSRRRSKAKFRSIVAASFLQTHPNAEVRARRSRRRRRSPAAARPGSSARSNWDRATIRKAVIWLARKLKKPILKLTDEDYNEEGLQDLLAEPGPAYNINIEVFRDLQQTITGWPGGKPAHASSPAIRVRFGEGVFPQAGADLLAASR